MDCMETCWRLAGDWLETGWRLAGNPVKFAGNKIRKPRDSGPAPPGLLPELCFLLVNVLLEIQLVIYSPIKLIEIAISSKRS